MGKTKDFFLCGTKHRWNPQGFLNPVNKCYPPGTFSPWVGKSSSNPVLGDLDPAMKLSHPGGTAGREFSAEALKQKRRKNTGSRVRQMLSLGPAFTSCVTLCNRTWTSLSFLICEMGSLMPTSLALWGPQETVLCSTLQCRAHCHLCNGHHSSCPLRKQLQVNPAV